MAGGGLVGDGTSIYFMTGNGTFDANTGGSNARRIVREPE